jgi:hypothetical protein
LYKRHVTSALELQGLPEESAFLSDLQKERERRNTPWLRSLSVSAWDDSRHHRRHDPDTAAADDGGQHQNPFPTPRPNHYDPD